jgi:hypothetical protein
MTIMHKNKKPAPITIIPKALPHMEREVIITYQTHVMEIDRGNVMHYVLSRINYIIRNSADITLPPFILTWINSNSKLVLTTNPTTPANAYVPYLQMITANIKALQLTDLQINGRLSKFLIHNVPTNAKLIAIKAEIETTYPSLCLAHNPHWLVPEECHLNKISSTVIISLICTIDLQHLGTTLLAICNRMCCINAYFS